MRREAEPSFSNLVPGYPLVAVLLLLAVVAIQIGIGAYRSERGLYSDESAHFMNGLVIRDYLRDGLGDNPLAFAREYYAQYPKIAPFVWPPLFHGVLGLWLLPGWPPMAAAIFLLACFTAWTAWRLHTIVATLASTPVSFGAVILFLATPTVVNLGSSVMVDIVIAAIALEAAYWLAAYFATGSRRDAVAFGACAALGCLAKGNGVAIVLMPLFMIVFTGQYGVLRRSGLYIAAAIVVVLAVPLLAFSYWLDAGLGDFGPVTLELVRERVVFYARHIWHQLGPAPVAFAGVGAIAALVSRRALSHAAGQPYARALVSLAAAGIVFHLLSPHILSHERYITLVLAPLLALTGLGVFAVSRVLRWRWWRWCLQLGLFIAMAIAHFEGRTTLAAQPPLGYREVVWALSRDGQLVNHRVLVVTDERGEGAAVAEVAVLALKPGPAVMRGSKVLASDDWMGRNFRLHYDSADAALAGLEALHVDYVVLDASTEAGRLGYWQQAHEMVVGHPDRVERIYTNRVDATRGPLRPLTVYRLKFKAQGPRPPITIGDAHRHFFSGAGVPH